MQGTCQEGGGSARNGQAAAHQEDCAFAGRGRHEQMQSKLCALPGPLSRAMMGSPVLFQGHRPAH
eukprot:8723652-Alexandrium_andersonii.AAC.1